VNVAKIMTKTVHTIGPDRTLKECAELLKQRHVNGLAVVKDGKVEGVITKADIFEALLPGYSDIYGRREQHCKLRIHQRADP
jgi:CBS domain-containing protein